MNELNMYKRCCTDTISQRAFIYLLCSLNHSEKLSSTATVPLTMASVKIIRYNVGVLPSVKLSGEASCVRGKPTRCMHAWQRALRHRLKLMQLVTTPFEAHTIDYDAI